jgi:hypothetical protein
MKRKWAQETSTASATSASLSSLQQKGQVSFSLNKWSMKCISFFISFDHNLLFHRKNKFCKQLIASILFQLRCSSPQYLERSPSVPSPFSWSSQLVSSSYAKAKVQCFFSFFSKILAKSDGHLPSETFAVWIPRTKWFTWFYGWLRRGGNCRNHPDMWKPNQWNTILNIPKRRSYRKWSYFIYFNFIVKKKQQSMCFSTMHFLDCKYLTYVSPDFVNTVGLV